MTDPLLFALIFLGLIGLGCVAVVLIAHMLGHFDNTSTLEHDSSF